LGFEKIFILGAGTIGSVYGAFLSEKSDVTLVGNRTHVDTVNSKGLTIIGETSRTVRLNADTAIRSISERALIILATKTYDSAKAIEGIRTILRDDTVILILQNGLGNEEVVRRIVGRRIRLLRGITAVAAEFSGLGEVRYRLGETVIGQGEAAAGVVAAFNECGLPARLSEDFIRDLWIKLAVNCVVNPLTAILGVRNNDVIVDSLTAVRYATARECIAVAEAEGVDMPRDLEQAIDKRVAGYSNFSSMCQDIMRKKRTEIDFLNGKVVELGKKHHIPTPVNEVFVGFIKYLEGRYGVSRED
jgi:2-dehydropantoate 2-reductase